MTQKTQLARMIALAAEYHDGQFDKQGQPYILHPITVMHYLNSTDEELQCIAVGHDIIEDTAVTVYFLRSRGFSERVIAGIDAMTKREEESLESYKARIFANKDAMLVKRADLKHNSDITRLRGVTDKDIARISKYHQFYLEINEKLAEIA